MTSTVPSSRRAHFWSRAYLMQDVDPQKSTGPLAGYCFITGFVDVIAFSAIYLWAGFQTGNTSQLGLAVARLFQGSSGHLDRDRSFHIADQLALVSILSFIFGAFLARIGDHMGAKTRVWLIIGTFIQALFTAAAAITARTSGQGDFGTNRGDVAWTNATSFATFGLISASVGLQGVMGKRLNTQFTTTIVLTTVWCELMADPNLFQFRRMVISRDHKILAIAALFVGAFVGRAILQATNGAVTLGIAAALRAAIVISWIFVPAKESRADAKEGMPNSQQATS